MMANNHKLDINIASVEDLERLTGIGHAKAKSIVRRRKTVGGFHCLTDLLEVSGIGTSLIDANRSQLTCHQFATSPAVGAVCVALNKLRRDTRSSSSSVAGPSTSIDACTQHQNRSSSAFVSPDPSSNDNAAASCSSTSTDDSFNATKRLSARSKVRDKNGRLGDGASQGSSDVPGGDNSMNNSLALDADNLAAKCDNTPESERQFVDNACQDDEEDDNNDDNDSDSDHDKHTCRYHMNNTLPSFIHEDGGSSSYGCGGFQRSRIPVPVCTNCSRFIRPTGMMKRKSDFHSSTKGMSPGKKLCRSASVFGNYLYGGSAGGKGTSSLLIYPSSSALIAAQRRRIPSKDNPPPRLAEWLNTFQMWSNAERLMALDDLIGYCEPTQVRHMMQIIEPQFQRDFISLLPKELALYVLSFLEPRDLLRAAQTCLYWRILAEDNLLWREKCREENIEEGAAGRLRRRSPNILARSPWKAMFMRQHHIERNWRSGPIRLPKVLKGHDDHVITCLEFSGNRIVSGSDDNTLKVWLALTGKCMRTLVGHTGGVWSSQMSGSTIISGSTDRTLKVWNADTGQCIHTLYGHTSTVRCMHLHGNKVVSGSRDATLRLWDVETGHCLHVLMGHVAAVRCVQYDGRRVVSGAYDYMVKVWDPETESCLHTLQGHTNRVYSLQFDGTHIVSGSLDTSIRVWDVETGNCLHTLMGHQSLTSGMELNDNILVSGNADSTVKVWDIRTGQCLQTLQGPNKHQSAVTCLQFNKKFVITSSDDGTVKIWDLRTGEFLRNLVSLDSGGSGGVVWRVRCSNTKLVCAVGSRNGTEETKLLVLDFDVDERKL